MLERPHQYNNPATPIKGDRKMICAENEKGRNAEHPNQDKFNNRVTPTKGNRGGGGNGAENEKERVLKTKRSVC